jgi:hypothetical protein
MNMACYSARAGAAFLPTAEGWLRMDADTPDTLQPCSAWEMTVALRDCPDVVELPADDVEQVHAALFHSVELMNACDLTLWLLDPSLSDGTRQSAARELNGFLSDANLVEAWKGIFWWQPLGPGADLERALKLARGEQTEQVVCHLQDLQDRQPSIQRVREALEAVLVSDTVERVEVILLRRCVQQERLHVAILEALDAGSGSVTAATTFNSGLALLKVAASSVDNPEWFRSWIARSLQEHIPLNPGATQEFIRKANLNPNPGPALRGLRQTPS